MSICNCETCFRNEQEREEKLKDRIGLGATVLSAVGGFVFLPFLITFLTGADIFETMAKGNIWFNIILYASFTLVGLFTGSLGIIVFKDRS